MTLRFKPPREWKVVRLDTVADVRSGVAKGRNGLKSPVSLPYLRVANVQDGYLDLSEIKQIEIEEHEVERYALQPGDVLMNEGGDFDKLGRGHLWQGELPVCLHQNHVFAVRPDSKQLDSRYLNYFTGSLYGKLYFLSCSKQSTNLASINSSQLRAMPIPVPPLGEQRRIAEILGAWDEAMEKVGKLIESKQKLKRSLMQQLLTGHRAAESSATRDWEHARLSELFEPVTREVGEHKTTVLSITATVGFVDQAAKFSRIIAGEQLTKYVLLKRGEFAYNKGNSNAYPQGCIYMLEEFDEGAVPHVYISFRAKDATAYAEFYKHFFAAGGLNRQLHRLINSGVRNDGLLNLDEDGFFAMRLPKPPLAQQRQIANAFTELDRELRVLKAHRAALTTQKRGLLEKLLKGAIRVKVDVSAPEAARA